MTTRSPDIQAARVILAGPEPLTETIEWIDASVERPSSVDENVLCWGKEGAFMGWYDGPRFGWCGCESGDSVLGVTHWARVKGPAC